jgi:hypothetical protein
VRSPALLGRPVGSSGVQRCLHSAPLTALGPNRHPPTATSNWFLAAEQSSRQEKGEGILSDLRGSRRPEKGIQPMGVNTLWLRGNERPRRRFPPACLSFC